MDLSPFDFFRQETSHTDVVIRTETMAKMSIVASLMGPDRTRADMLPYLQAKIDDMDQVLLVIARKIGDFGPIVGGAEHVHALVPIIEALCGIEETTVRAAAADSACKVLSIVSPTNKASVAAFLALFKRLSNEETSGDAFYSRVSACQMVHELYRVVSDTVERTTIREIFTTLSRDEMIMVRRAAAFGLPKLAREAELDIQTGELLQLLKALAADEHQNVKVIAIENCITYSILLNEINASSTAGLEVVPIIRGATDDSSWRVRVAISKNYGNLASCYPSEIAAAELLPGLVNLLQDTESDVRISALTGAYSFFNVCGGELFINEISVVVQQLVEDPVVTVRKSLAELCVDVTAHAVGEGPGQTIFSDTVCRLLADEDPLVRLRVIKKLPLIAEEVSSLCSKITPSLRLMFSESNWRVRKELILTMPSVVKHMGPDYFSDYFLSEFLARFKDGVNEVREAAAQTLTGMVNSSTATWVYDHIFPTIRGMAEDEYMFRMTMLDSLLSLAKAELPERFRSEIISLVLSKIADTVANIRLRVAQVIGSIGLKFGQDIFQGQFKPALLQLQSDRDRDVKWFATESLKVST